MIFMANITLLVSSLCLQPGKNRRQFTNQLRLHFIIQCQYQVSISALFVLLPY